MPITLDGTTGIDAPLGTAASPSYGNTTATTTGLYFPTSTTLGLSTNGTAALTIDASQNVGIGTASPGAALDIGGAFPTVRIVPSTNTNNALYRSINAGGTAYLGLDGSAGGLTTAYALNLYHTGAYPIVFSTNSAERMRIDSSGNVGVGTTSINARTEIQKDSTATAPLTDQAIPAWNSGVVLKNTSATNAGYTALSLIAANTAGTSQAYSIVSQSTSSGYAPNLLFLSRNATGTGSDERMRIDSSGNVGVGTSSPSTYSAKFVSYGAFGTSTPAISLVNSSAENVNNVAETQYWLTNSFSGLVNVAKIGAISGSTGNQYGALYFSTSNAGAPTERMRIDSSGNLLVGTTTSTSRLTVVDSRYGLANVGTAIVSFSDSNGRYSNFYAGADGTSFNAANTILGVRNATGTGRSINASGTINASGADYAEYMTKAGDFVIAKGDIVGINAEGKLTNVFSDAVSFVVKSTNPSYVGGDTWGNGDAIGERPSPNAAQEEQNAFEVALETARQKVDRIAFAGQVPVNVFGAIAGQYIIPVNDNGAIKGEAVSNPTFEQYQIAVGKVIAVEDDGRAKIIVKVA